MTVRIVIDGRPLVGERTGIGVYTAEIAARLDADIRPLLASHAPIRDLEGIEEIDRRVDPAPLGVLWQQGKLARIVEQEDAALLWGPHGTIPLGLRRPAVINVHDLTAITMPRAHRLRTLLSFNPIIGQSIARAERIMVISRHTADAIVRGFAVSPSQIEIVPGGVNPYFSPGPAPNDEEPFILYVGSIEPRKGIGDLIDAWESLGDPPRLVLAGASGWKNEDLRRRARPGIESGKIEVTGFIDRPTLRDLYRRCTVFVYPSHFEGFGLPILEAMACGAPVLTTRGGAIPEAAGDAGIIVDPGDPEALARELRRLLGSAALRRELRERGIERAASFDWNRPAKTASEVFRSVGGS